MEGDERPTAVVEQEFEEDDSVHCAEIVFEVEECLFKVPRRWFEDSPVFRDVFDLPIDTAMSDGSSIERPLRLGDVTRADFEKLLEVMAASFGQAESLHISEQVLKLSVMWGIQAIKKLAIKQIFHDDASVDPRTKIKLAREYGLTEELLPSLNQFTRRRLVTAEDANALGLDYFLKILEIQGREVRVEEGRKLNGPKQKMKSRGRDSYGYRMAPYPKPHIVDPYSRQKHDFTKFLQPIFQEEMQRLDGLTTSIRSGPERAYNPAVPVHLGCPKKDDRFFPIDVFFLVENCLFKGSRQSFDESPVFRKMFDLPIPGDVTPEGLSRSSPIRLEGIKKSNFKQLLKFMNTRFGQEDISSVEEWTSVLKISTMWEFDRIRKISIDIIFKLCVDVVEKIVIARDYHVTEWFMHSLNEYAKLDRPISVDDVDRLGLEYLLKIVEARQTDNDIYSDFRFMWRMNCTDALRSIFKDEIEGAQKTWSMSRISTDPPSYVITGTRSLKSV